MTGAQEMLHTKIGSKNATCAAAVLRSDLFGHGQARLPNCNSSGFQISFALQINPMISNSYV
jgi:hypothetical protein